MKKSAKEDLAKKVIDFIGYPPKAVMFTMIQNEFPKISTKDLEAVMDFLWEKELINVFDNGWISGKRQQNLSSLTSDDLDWYFGMGRYAQ